jgi:hypothetical protein
VATGQGFFSFSFDLLKVEGNERGLTVFFNSLFGGGGGRFKNIKLNKKKKKKIKKKK